MVRNLEKAIMMSQYFPAFAAALVAVVAAAATADARALTDNNGRYYKVMPRFGGKYRVTPVVRGYQFTPASADVSGSGGTANITGVRK